MRFGKRNTLARIPRLLHESVEQSLALGGAHEPRDDGCDGLVLIFPMRIAELALLEQREGPPRARDGVADDARRMQRGRKHDAALHEELDDDRAADDGDGPADDAARGELLRILGDALLTLDPRDRALVLLADAEDWTAPEIGAQLDMTPEAVRTRLSRAHRRLRDALGPVHDAL